MVTVKIGDGMGNQMYNYACGYAVARKTGEELRLDISECDNSTLRDFEPVSYTHLTLPTKA